MFHLWLWSPLSPPPQDYPAQTPCLQKFFPSVHFSLFLLPPLRPFFVNLPSPQWRRLSPAVCSYAWLAASAMLPLVSWPMSRCLGVCPPDLCGWRYFARAWVEGRRRRPPPMVLRSSMRLAIPTGINRSIFRALDTPRPSWCSSLSPP